MSTEHKMLMTVAVALVVVGAYFIVVRGQSEMHGSKPLNTNSDQLSRPKVGRGVEPDDAAHAKEVISRDNRFATCGSYNLDFKEVLCTNIPLMSGAGKCDISSGRSQRILQLLDRTGIARSIGSNSEGYWLWAQTPQAHAAIGTTIIQEQTGPSSNLWMDANYGDAIPYRWKIITGCREFSSIDATTPLEDGVRMDFSWHWKPTGVGRMEGLTEQRQRGVAYLVRKNEGLAIDQIQIGAEKDN